MLNQATAALTALSLVAMALPAAPPAQLYEPEPVAEEMLLPQPPPISHHTDEPEEIDWYAGCVATAVVDNLSDLEMCVTEWFPACLSMVLTHLVTDVQSCQIQ